MNLTTRPASSRAILVLTVAVLALAGCGRKGGLDLPPQSSSSAQPLASSAPAVEPDSNSAAAKGNALFGASSGDDSQPAAARGRKKPFVLDPLLD